MAQSPPTVEILSDRGFPETVPELLAIRAQTSPQTVAYREYLNGDEWDTKTWADYWQTVQRVAAGLKAQGVVKGLCIAIMLPTSFEWDVMDRAALLLGAIVVGIEPHASPDHIEFVIKNSGANMLFVKNAQLDAPSLATLRTLDLVIALEGQVDDAEVKSVSWQSLLNVEAESETGFVVSGDDPATLVYTSGTTGTPKGILYTHAQVMAACESILQAFGAGENYPRWICWLPLANLFQRIFNLCAMGAGASIYLVDDPLQVMQRVESAKPSVFIGVPRFYEKLYAGIMSRIESMPGWQKSLAKKAISTAMNYQKVLRAGKRPPVLLSLQYRLADKLVLGKLRQVMGGEMRLMLTGSAACPLSVLEFFHAIGLPLLEAYGMSENIIPMSANRPDDYCLGSVGKPLQYNEIRIAETGEILVKGRGVFSGYLGSDKHCDSFTPEGFFRTSDYGCFDDEGFLHLKERKSEVIKTSTGRRISLVRIESVLRQVQLIDQVVVIGSGRKLLVAVVTLEQSWLPTFLQDKPLAIERIASAISNAGGVLAKYERVAGCVVLTKPFSVGEGEVTPNLKLRRAVIETNYAEYVERLYELLETSTQAEGETENTGEEVLVLCP